MNKTAVYGLAFTMFAILAALTVSSVSEDKVYYVDNFETSYNTSNSNNSSPIKFDAELVDQKVNSSNPAKIQLMIEPTSTTNVSLIGGPVYPFGVLNAESREDNLVLWSKRYEENSAISTEQGRVTTIGAIRIIGEHSGGETVSRNYSVRLKDIERSDNYTAKESIKYRTDSGRGNLSYRFSFDLKKQ
ncbi:MAG: hypothetical protein BRC29_01390 [Nanohaloarchaea archaeon SW_7_43_1]|nr:MAG: hypothetical protein BRC29_01390 [Nanohaloarchaea archaeon SW_7_43_1]